MSYTDSSANRELAARVRAEQIKQLYSGFSLAAIATIINAGLLVVVLWAVILHTALLTWAGIVLCITLARAVLVYRYKTLSPGHEQNDFWLRAFFVGTLLAGISWGATVVVLFTPDDIAYQMLLVFVLTGMGAGATTTLSAVWGVSLAFLIPSILPLALRFFAFNTTLTTAMGVMLLLYLAVIINSIHRIYENIRENLVARIERAPHLQALRRSEELLQRTGQLAQVGGWELDLVELSLRWTEQTYAIHELDFGEQADLQEAINFFDPVARPIIEDAVNKAIQQGLSYDLELPFITAKGNHRWVRAVGLPHMEDGMVVRLSGVIQDITQRKQTEDALKKNLHSLERLHSITADISLTFEQKTDRLLQLGREVFGLSMAIISRIEQGIYHIEHVVGPQGAPEPDTSFDLSDTYCEKTLSSNRPIGFHHAANGEMQNHPCYLKFQLEAYIGAPIIVDGEAYGTLNFSDAEPRTLPFSDSDISLVKLFAQWVGHEISRLNDQKKLIASEQAYRLLLDSVNEGIYGLDLHGNATFVNPAATRMLGYRAEELIGKSMHTLIHHSYSDGTHYPRDKCPMYAAFTDGTLHATDDEVLWRKDGSSFSVEYASTPVRKEGALVGAVVTFRDITQRKHIDRIKSEFISTVSHELRTPLTSIRGSLGLVRGGASGEIPEKAEALIEIAYNNCERLIPLINDILDMEKIASGEVSFDMKIHSVQALVEQALEANAAYGEQLGIRFILTNEPVDYMVKIDAARFLQVMSNLLSNAAKFSPEDGHVDITIGLNNDFVRVSVTDQGQGIPVEFQDHVFEKFSQADASDTRTKGGTGLGLNISKTIIENMHGHIGFETDLGKGTAFFFDLPLYSVELNADQTNVVVADNGSRVLICEDDKDIARLLAIILRNGGVSVDIVYDAEQAKNMLRRNHYDAMTLDLILPGQDGISLIRELRSHDATKELPIVVVSAKMKEGRLAINGDFSAIDWLEKPIDETRLVNAVTQFLRQTADNRPRILHVEDDPDLCKIVSSMAQDLADFDCAPDLKQARDRLSQDCYSLVILDLGLPDGSGWELLPLLKSLHPQPPVVVLSVNNISSEEAKQVSAAFVKTQISNDELLHTIQGIIGKTHTEI